MASGRSSSGNSFFVETTFVLFFLSLDFGQNLFNAGFDTAFVGITIIALSVFPYFLPSASNIGLSSWITGRSAVFALGLFLGIGLFQAAGAALPEVVRFLPLPLATISGAVCCYRMFSGFFRVDYAA